MATEPSEDDIRTLCSITSIGRSEAILRLKGNNHNVEQAANEYFDDPNPSKYRWDEGAFASDRDGATNPSITFSVDASDPRPYNQSRFDGAPSRPPSRTSNTKSPAGIIDLTEEHARADPNNSLGRNQDDDLQRALAASREDAGLPPQETGITSASDPYFGPATRTDYERGQWELVPLGKEVSQEIPEPPPAARKRELDAPVFLRSSADDHRLAALLTIYHEIPISRELFLDRMDQPNHYEYDNQWWAGRTIEQPYIDGSDGLELLSENRKFTQELQRLMAFLDKTERAYGSVDALTKTSAMKRALRLGTSARDLESVFFDVWKEIFKNGESMWRNLFSKGVAHAKTPYEQSKDFAILDLTLPAENSSFETLYDIADEVLWPTPALEFASSAYLDHIGEIITFRMEGHERSSPDSQDGSKGIDVPLVWYPDRYMEAARQAALDMRLEKNKIVNELRRIDDLESNLTYMPYRGTHIKVEHMLKVALRHDQDEVDDKDDLNMEHHNENQELPVAPSAAVKLSTQLQALMISINNKLRSLEEEKLSAWKTLKQVSKLLTKPSTNLDGPKLQEYTLRGVSTTKNQTYVCRRAEPDLIDMDLDGDDSMGNKDQWWSITYGASETKPVSVEKTTPQRVLEAAKSESRHILLVYASQKAMGVKQQAILPALETFIQEDNKAFRDEFPIDIPDSQQSAYTQPRSPQKRKYAESQEEQEMSRWNGTQIYGREGSQVPSEGDITVTSTEIESQEVANWSFVGSGKGSERSQGVFESVDDSNGDGEGFDDDYNRERLEDHEKSMGRDMVVIEGVDPLNDHRLGSEERVRQVEMEERARSGSGSGTRLMDGRLVHGQGPVGLVMGRGRAVGLNVGMENIMADENARGEKEESRGERGG